MRIQDNIFIQCVRVKFCHQFLGISDSVSDKILLVFDGLHVPIFINLNKCFLRRHYVFLVS